MPKITIQIDEQCEAKMLDMIKAGRDFYIIRLDKPSSPLEALFGDQVVRLKSITFSLSPEDTPGGE